MYALETLSLQRRKGKSEIVANTILHCKRMRNYKRITPQSDTYYATDLGTLKTKIIRTLNVYSSWYMSYLIETFSDRGERSHLFSRRRKHPSTIIMLFPTEILFFKPTFLKDMVIAHVTEVQVLRIQTSGSYRPMTVKFGSDWASKPE